MSSILKLTGCTYQPLAAYLKSLAVLRLVAQQAARGQDARGWWDGECFSLESEFDEEGLIDFFLKTYRPTPILAPWNGGSGFYEKDKKGIAVTDQILKSYDDRFQDYRAAVIAARNLVERYGGKSGNAGEEDLRRSSILRECRNRLPDSFVDWADAAMAIAADESRAFPPILGTGGNEGRMDYTVNFMENVVNLLVAPKKRPVRSLLMNTLFDSPTAGLEAIAVGQYDPGRAGGANQGAGVTTDALANPWTALLTMEGAVVWAGGVYRRQGAGFRSYLCSPFTVRPSMVGFGSASVKDEETARAEVWAPLWRRPSRYEEIRALFREGRASVDDKPARTGLDFAKAVGSLGTDRGIGQFVRFTMLKRRGDSYVAPPLGVFDNQQRRVADLIGELDPTLRAMDGSAKDSSGEAPASWKSARRQVDEALYQTLLRDDPEQFLALVAAIGDCQKWLLRRGKQVQPSLTQSWIERCLDVREYRAEVRIAAALSGIRHPNLGPLADNLTNDGTNFAWVGRSLPERMIATLEKRVWMGEGTERSSLWSRSRATRTDVKAFLKGSTDDDLLERLMFAFTLVKHAGEQRREVDRTALPPLFCAVKLLFGGTAAVSSDDESITFEPDGRVPRLLRAGRANEAWQIARTRMLVNGLMPIDGQFAELSQEEGARYAAALLIPLADMKDLLGTVLQSRPETGDRE